MIFDLDGTLWDSTQSAPFIWKRVLDKHHLDISITQEKVASLMGKTMEEIGNILEIKLLMILVKKRSII